MEQFLAEYLPQQATMFFPDKNTLSAHEWKKVIGIALAKLKASFQYINSDYYRGAFEEKFNYLNGDHYAMLLYVVSRAIYCELNNEIMASKIFLLNKALHGIDAFYKVILPEIFLFVHPIGTILGRATYGNFLCVYQGCSIGSKVGEYAYPEFGDNVTLYAHVSILGKCKIGSNVTVGANTFLLSTDVESNHLVLGTYPNNRMLEYRPDQKHSVFLL